VRGIIGFSLGSALRHDLSPFPCPLRLYLPSKRELLIAMGMTQNLLNPCGNYVKRGHKGKILIKGHKCGSRRLPKKKLKA
jgi:hypothetical protein